MKHSESDLGSSGPNHAALRDKALMYGLVVSIIGLPIGVVLGLPVVWGLSILGIVIGAIKTVLRRSGT